MNFIKKHKIALIIAFVCLFLMGLAAMAVYRMFYPSNDRNIYGNRLDNAPEIKTEVIDAIKTGIIDTKIVDSVEYSTVVVTMKFFIDVKPTVKIVDAEKLSDIILSKLDNSVLTFYDIQVYLTQKEGEFKEYPAIGTHSKSSQKFIWLVNKEGVNSEA